MTVGQWVRICGALLAMLCCDDWVPSPQMVMVAACQQDSWSGPTGHGSRAPAPRGIGDCIVPKQLERPSRPWQLGSCPRCKSSWSGLAGQEERPFRPWQLGSCPRCWSSWSGPTGQEERPFRPWQLGSCPRCWSGLASRDGWAPAQDPGGAGVALQTIAAGLLPKWA